MNRVFGATAVLAVLATGCATRGTVNRLQTDVAALRTEVAASRASQELAARDLALARAELEALATRARELGESVRAAREELAKLAARLDAAEEENRKTRALVEARAPAAPAPAPAAPAEPRAEARPGPRVAPPVTSRAAEQVYAAALATFRAREYGQAVLDFIDFIGTYPKHALAANAQYWIGEAYYIQRDYRQALVEFQKVLEMRSGKIPDALVKIGLCQWTLRDPRRARAAWQRVVRDYPSTESARLARALLRKHAAAQR
jgi:tol-pal system protein YbgF